MVLARLKAIFMIRLLSLFSEDSPLFYIPFVAVIVLGDRFNFPRESILWLL